MLECQKYLTKLTIDPIVFYSQNGENRKRQSRFEELNLMPHTLTTALNETRILYLMNKTTRIKIDKRANH